MIPDNPTFFPARNDREILNWVIEDFPFPVALGYARLQDYLDQQTPVEAAWQLKDSFESLLKLITCVAIADFLQARPDPATATAIVSLLFKRGGLSVGDWVTLLIGQDDNRNKGALRDLEPFVRSKTEDKSGRYFPEFFNLCFTLKGKNAKQFSEIARRIKGGGGSTDPNKQGFVSWRNRVFGHGAFKANYGFYAAETTRWLSFFHEVLIALRPTFNNWSLISSEQNGQETVWQGSLSLPEAESHTHETDDAPLVMRLKHRSSSHSLALGPLVSVQKCVHCNHPTPFFFDSNRYDSKKSSHRTYFLEYFGGHEKTYQNWLETQKLAAKLPPQFDWKRSSYDSEEVWANLSVIFRDFDDELVRPDYLLDKFWRLIDTHSKGYVWLEGESGIGKTFFVRALELEGKDRGVAVLAYHILSGPMSDYQTFVSELSDRARQTLRFHTQEAQTKVAGIADFWEQFAEYLAELMRANTLDTLILAIDGLDELPEPEAGTAAITSLLPASEYLPAGCFILLTSREVLRPTIREDLQRLEQQHDARSALGQSECFARIEINTQDSENQSLVKRYLHQRLPERFRDDPSVDLVLQRCGAVFLYAFHFCRALETAAFADVQLLPETTDFYPTYLAHLKEATGKLFSLVYLRSLLLLSAAQTPASATQLVEWGIPKKDLPIDLPIALLGIKDFLRLHRARAWFDSLSNDEGEDRYEIAHEDFNRYLREDEVMANHLREAHAAIARKTLAKHHGKWDELDPEDLTQLYALRFVLTHLREAGMTEEALTLRNDEGYAQACVAVGKFSAERHRIAIDLYNNALHFYRARVTSDGPDSCGALAEVLMNRGFALWRLGRLTEAIASHEESIAVYRTVAQTGETDGLIGLSTALMNLGNAIGTQLRSPEALKYFDEAIEIRRGLVRSGRSDLENDLARTLMNKGTALWAIGLLADAEKCLIEATDIRQQLVDAGDDTVTSDLARVVSIRGAILRDSGNPTGAITHFDRAIKIYQKIITDSQGRRSDIIEDWLLLLTNTGNALHDLGDFEQALKYYEETIGFYGDLVDEGRIELSHHLAGALMNKANLLRDTGSSELALLFYDRAIRMYQALLGGGRDELTADFASVLMNKGNALSNLNQPGAAAQFYGEAFDLFESLTKIGRVGFENDLAGARLNHGNMLSRLGELEQAVEYFDEAITIRRSLIERGRIQLRADLAAALEAKGGALFNHGKEIEALKYLDEAITIYRELVATVSAQWVEKLSNLLNFKGIALLRAHKLKEAIDFYAEAVAIHKLLIEAGHTELDNKLAEVISNMGLVYLEHGDHTAAIKCYDEAIAMAWRLISVRRRSIDFVIALMESRGLVFARQSNHRNLVPQLEEILNWRAACVDAGLEESLNPMAQYTRFHIQASFALDRVEGVAKSLSSLLARITKLYPTGPLPKSLTRQLSSMQELIETRTVEEQKHIYVGIGTWREVMNKLLSEENEDDSELRSDLTEPGHS